MITKFCSFFFLCLVLALSTLGQRIASIEIEITKPLNGLVSPAQIDLDGITFLPDSMLSLVLIKGTKRISVPIQIYTNNHRYLTWLIQTENGKEKKLMFELIRSPDKNSITNSVNAVVDNGALTIQYGKQNLLRYQFEKIYPPKGADSAYARGGFIHPLWSPHGQILTRIQPPDHYHHYGIWNPWTHALYEGDTVDFWNLKDKKGTVQFANLLYSASGPVFSEYAALHQHVVFKKSGIKKDAMNEVQTVRVFRPDDRDYYIADITVSLSCTTESPVQLLTYRYGGLGWRTTEQWDRYNSEVLTSEGKSRKDADGSTARWCMIQGPVDKDYAGVVLMSYPGNYNHPEPLRIWPENQYDRGDLFANFSPTKNKDWTILPGKIYTLKYRLLVFNGKQTAEVAESGWQYFAAPFKISVKQTP
jgi:hypothetical protein